MIVSHSSALPVSTDNNSIGNEPIPLVIVEGFLGGAGALIWANFEENMNLGYEQTRRVIFAKYYTSCWSSFDHLPWLHSVGPVSRCTTGHANYIMPWKGEQVNTILSATYSCAEAKYIVDYGADHCKQHRHLRYGHTIDEGMYPQWSQERPLHFLGHLLVIYWPIPYEAKNFAGASTIVKLQWLCSSATRNILTWSCPSTRSPRLSEAPKWYMRYASMKTQPQWHDRYLSAPRLPK